MVFVSDVRCTDVEDRNPSTVQQRLDAAQHQADREVGVEEEAINVWIGTRGTQTGHDSWLWWPVTYQVIPRRGTWSACPRPSSRLTHRDRQLWPLVSFRSSHVSFSGGIGGPFSTVNWTTSAYPLANSSAPG